MTMTLVETDHMAQSATADATAAAASPDVQITGLREVCELLRQQLDDVREDRDRWRAEADKWRAQAEHLALAAPALETKPPITRYLWEPPLEQAATFPPLK